MTNSLEVFCGYFKDAIKKAFDIQAKIDVDVQYKMTDAKALPRSEVLSTLSLSSTHFVGSLALSFPEKSFLMMLEKLFGEKVAAIDGDNCDACSELLNIIYGTARRPINEKGFDFGLAIPSTITGKGLAMHQQSVAKQALLFSCNADIGEFWLSLFLRKA